MSKTNNVAVSFLKRWRAYNPGEVAGFDPQTAEKLVEGGAAEYADKARTKRSGTKAADTKKTPEDEKQPPDGSSTNPPDDDARP